MPNVRPLNKKKYGISKHAFGTAYSYCLQYPEWREEFPIVKDTASDITTPRLYNIKSTPKLLISKIGACFHI